MNLSYLKETLFLNAFSFWKIPLIFFLRPSVIKWTAQRIEIKIPLNRRSKNHLNSMYFGALTIGADCAGGLLAMRLIQESKKDIALVFKDLHADFLKRAESDVHFSCDDGDKVRQLVENTIRTGERQNMTVNVVATAPKSMGDEPVAKFKLTLSLKDKTATS